MDDASDLVWPKTVWLHFDWAFPFFWFKSYQDQYATISSQYDILWSSGPLSLDSLPIHPLRLFLSCLYQFQPLCTCLWIYRPLRRFYLRYCLYYLLHLRWVVCLEKLTACKPFLLLCFRLPNHSFSPCFCAVWLSSVCRYLPCLHTYPT